MAALNPELPAKGTLSLRWQLSGCRLLAASAAGHGPGAPKPAPSNRPIPLKPKSDNPIPDADRYEDDDEEVDDLREILRNAPAWLVSTVFHTLLLIILALLAAVSTRIPPADVDVQVSNYAEQLGTQLEDPSVMTGENSHVENPTEPEQMITPRDLPPVDDPLAAPSMLGDIKLDVGLGAGTSILTGPQTIEGAPIGLALSGRSAGSKNVLLGRYGGNRTTEAAVELGLKWLAAQQKSDGSWSLSGPFPDGAGSENNAAATAMALLAFQGHGDTTHDGAYSKVVSRAWHWLLNVQRKDGSFSGGTMNETTQLLYTHAQCTIALCELFGMTHDSTYRGPAEKAIAYAVASQDKKYGGWRYSPGQDSDTSVTGWFLMALQSARMAGLAVPGDTLKGVSHYLDSAALDGGRRYGYWQGSSSTLAMCAEGLLCREYLGWKHNDPRLVEGVTALTERPVSYAPGSEQDAYYWYYATQAAHHMGGEIWDAWNKAMRQEIPAHQVKEGPQAGSWNPAGDRWA
ncbi:MAG TPA: prenyltransferase/squalene oxidase repeat-containing protein, partial [Pirellulales bacterium]|nr:prenyltransferase/squalene oxidase repeat-containing protein [Pirellulales bacterium]